MKAEEITIKTIIEANKTKVWDYYTKPEHIINWNFASEDWCCPKASNDLKIGGIYNARMEAKDGSFGFDFEAIYKEIIIGEKLSYFMGKELGEGRKAIVTFKDHQNSTEVTVLFDAEMENPIDMQRDGWQAILNNFKKYVESH